MSTETNALAAVEKEPSERQLTQCRKIICAVEKGDVHLAARLFEALRKMLRGIEKSRARSADEKLDAIALLARLKKANRDPERDDDASSAPGGATGDINNSERHPLDWSDITRVLGWQYDRFREPVKRIDRDQMLAELIGADLTVSAVQQLILDLRRPEPGGCRLLSFTIVFNAAKQYLDDNGAQELPREAVDLEYEKSDKSFEQRMRERGVEEKLV